MLNFSFKNAGYQPFQETIFKILILEISFYPLVLNCTQLNSNFSFETYVVFKTFFTRNCMLLGTYKYYWAKRSTLTNFAVTLYYLQWTRGSWFGHLWSLEFFCVFPLDVHALSAQNGQQSSLLNNE